MGKIEEMEMEMGIWASEIGISLHWRRPQNDDGSKELEICQNVNGWNSFGAFMRVTWMRCDGMLRMEMELAMEGLRMGQPRSFCKTNH